MFGFVPEEMSWAAMQEHELEARRIAQHATRRGNGHSLRALLARKLVQTGLRLDDDAGIAVLKHAESVG